MTNSEIGTYGSTMGIVETENEENNFDKVMEMAGNDGKFQKIFNYVNVLFLFGAVGMIFLNNVLILNEPDHACRVPGRENFNVSREAWRNLTLPVKIDNRQLESWSSCSMYNISSQMNKPIEEWKFTQSDSISCVYGYEYDKTWYERTAVSDEDWVCEKVFYQTNAFVFHRIGNVIGTFFVGQLGDMIGRRPVFILSVIIIVLSRVMMVFTTSIYVLFAIAFFMSTFTVSAVYASPLIIGMEISKNEKRSKIAMLEGVGLVIGMCILPGVFWLVRDWVWFLLITTIPICFYVFFTKYMIESPRWLATKNKHERCAKELNKIAKINGKPEIFNETMLKEMLGSLAAEKNYGMLSLFSSWRLAQNTIINCICWICFQTTYFVLALNSTRLGGNPFLSFFYQNFVELPAYIGSRYFCDWVGRRYANVISFLLITIICAVTAFLVKDFRSEILIGSLISIVRFFNNVSYYSINLQTLEMFPTCLRQSGYSIGGMVGGIFSASSSYIMYLGTEFDVRYPYIILVAISLIGCFAAMLLPETLNKKLPNTLKEAKVFK